MPGMAVRSSPTEKWGPLAARTTARTSRSAPRAAMASGRSAQKSGPMALRFSGRSSHRVATWPSTSMVRTSERKESMVGALMGAQRRAPTERPSGPTGAGGPDRVPSGAGSMDAEARRSGLDPREAPTLPTFTPDNAAALPGAPWLTRRRIAAAEAFASSPLPTEKDEVWRYSRIDQLDLDRFHPAGSRAPRRRPGAVARRDGSTLWSTASGPAAAWSSPSTASWPPCRPRSATTWCRSDGPPTTPRAPTLLGPVLGDPHDFPLLNDAFAIDPLVIDVRRRCRRRRPGRGGPRGLRGRRARPCSPARSSGSAAGASAGVIELVVDADTGLLADAPTDLLSATGSPVERLVVPVTELQVDDGASLAYVSIQSLGRRHLADRPPGQHHRRRRLAVELRGGPRRQLRPAAHRLGAGGRFGSQPACVPRSSGATTRCSTSAPSRTTGPPAPRATSCSWVRWPTPPTRSTAA